MKMLIAIGLPVSFLFLYELYKLQREGRKQHLQDMNSQQRVVCILNVLLIIVGIFFIIVGILRDYQFAKRYIQNGIYIQGEITDRDMRNRLRGYDYKIKITYNGESKEVDSWAETYYDLSEKKGLYFIDEQSTQDLYVMLEGENHCIEGYCMIENGLFILVIAVIVLGIRYNHL